MGTEAQKRANKKQNEKRRGGPQLSLRLTAEEYQLIEKAINKSGLTKKGLIIYLIEKYIDS